MKPVYTEYSRHCLRFYCRNPFPNFTDTVSELNWKACDMAFKEFDDNETGLLTQVYQSKDHITDTVYELSNKYDLPQTTIWKWVGMLERKVAQERGLA